MEYKFNIKLTSDELDLILTALEKMPMGEVLDVTKTIANQIDEQNFDAHEFSVALAEFEQNWKPSPPEKLNLDDFFKTMGDKGQANMEARKKPHWTQTPAGKKKMAARKRAAK